MCCLLNDFGGLHQGIEEIRERSSSSSTPPSDRNVQKAAKRAQGLPRVSWTKSHPGRVGSEPTLVFDDYDIHPDGKTLALVRPAGDARGREITLVVDWLTELQRVGRQ